MRITAQITHSSSHSIHSNPKTSFSVPSGVKNNIFVLNEYRRGVGICLVNRASGLVFAARRSDDNVREEEQLQGEDPSKWQVFSAVQPSDQNHNHLPPTNDSSTTLQKFTQLWAIILPVGYGFIPFITSALQPTLGSQQAAQATSALLGESLILILITRVITTNNYSFIPSKPSHFSYGIAAGISSLAIALLLPLLPLLLLHLSPTTTTTTLHSPSIENPLFLLPLFISTSILAPIIEEMVYRGYLQHRLVNNHNYSPTSAVLVSAAAFSVGHLQQSSFGVFQLFIIGIAFGVAYQLTQDGSGSTGGNYVGASIIAHVVYNTALFTDAASNGIWPV